MIKLKLTNLQEYKSLLKELEEDDDTSIHFENEMMPNSFPCIAIHNYASDTDFGSSYQIAFVYPTDFHSLFIFQNN